MAEIPFWIHDKPKWVSGITRHTTCQDILVVLVKTDRKSNCLNIKDEISEDLICKEISEQLIVVEQWQGVEQPLRSTSKILQLWQAWRDERENIKFVIKRLSKATILPDSLTTNSNGLETTYSERQRYCSKPHHQPVCDNKTTQQSKDNKIGTVHFIEKMKATRRIKRNIRNDEIEKLMQLILAQREIIQNQLKKMQEQEGQMEPIEGKVRDDYLVLPHLEHLPSSSSPPPPSNQGTHLDDGSYIKDKFSCGDPPHDKIPDRIKETLETLTKVYNLNEEIQEAEEKIFNLRCQLKFSFQSGRSGLEKIQTELKDLRSMNNARGKEIDVNCQKISQLRKEVEARQDVVIKLERDKGNAEIQGKQLEVQLQKLEDHHQQHPLELLCQSESKSKQSLKNELVEIEGGTKNLYLNNSFLDDGHFIISNEELYSQDRVTPFLGNTKPESQCKQTLSLAKDSLLKPNQKETPSFLTVCITDTKRPSSTGSPGGASSSGISSDCSERDLLISASEILQAPFFERLAWMENLCPIDEIQSALNIFVKKTATNPTVDNDSYSDTGLSSLHSSSDEGTYILDTLV